MKRMGSIVVLLGVLGMFAPRVSAQTNAVAIAALQAGNIFDGFVGPFRGTATGVDFNYVVLCVNVVTRVKVVTSAIVSIPDGATLAQFSSLTTAGVIAACSDQGYTAVPSTVFLPAVQRGS